MSVRLLRTPCKSFLSILGFSMKRQLVIAFKALLCCSFFSDSRSEAVKNQKATEVPNFEQQCTKLTSEIPPGLCFFSIIFLMKQVV